MPSVNGIPRVPRGAERLLQQNLPQGDIDLGYSITSSARRKNEAGILILSALAVC